jgi:hypothetical protein
LCCLSFFDLRLLITPLVSSTFLRASFYAYTDAQTYYMYQTTVHISYKYLNKTLFLLKNNYFHITGNEYYYHYYHNKSFYIIKGLPIKDRDVNLNLTQKVYIYTCMCVYFPYFPNPHCQYKRFKDSSFIFTKISQANN